MRCDMNKLYIYSVKDVVAGNFSNLEMFVNKEVALRWFNQLLKESKIAGDLQLYCLGTYDINTGVIVADVEFVQGGVVNE